MDVLTTTQAGERLSCSPKVIRRYISEGRLVPALTVPGERGTVLLSAGDVDRLASELADEADARAAALRGVTA
jgi:Glu-tRNA(Gln) amidotransferase subunit E-like FAD-binding protein